MIDFLLTGINNHYPFAQRISIVKRIVDSYSGKIEVESDYGEGTIFKVFLLTTISN